MPQDRWGRGMPDHRITADKHERIFGPPTVTGARPGRRRFYTCRFCGELHQRGAAPDNCREPEPRRPTLAAPLIAPPFQPFKTGMLDTAEVITNRHEKREYMARNDLVEYDTGVEGQRTPDWVADRQHEAEVVSDIKRFIETDPLNISPDLKAERMDESGSLDEGTEISADNIEVVK